MNLDQGGKHDEYGVSSLTFGDIQNGLDQRHLWIFFFLVHVLH